MLHHLCIAMMYFLIMSSSGTVHGYDTPFSLSEEKAEEIVAGRIEEAEFLFPGPDNRNTDFNHAFVMSSSDGMALFTETSVVSSFLGEFLHDEEYDEYLVAGTMTMKNPIYYKNDDSNIDHELAISGTVCEVEDSKECKVLFLTIKSDGSYHFVEKDFWCEHIADCAPTMEPTPLCEDLDTPFDFYNGNNQPRARTCAWFEEQTSKKKSKYCNFKLVDGDVVSHACPVLCNFCYN